jgi:hypothetical protein
MGDVLSESEIYVYSKRFLRNCGWKLVGGEPPGGSNALPRVEAKHPEREGKGSEGSKKVDVIAYRDGNLLLLELKSTFDERDVMKLNELVSERRWRQSLLEACTERNALDRANVQDSDLSQRILSGEALVRGIGLGRYHEVPREYVLLVFHSATAVDTELGTECPLNHHDFRDNNQ